MWYPNAPTFILEGSPQRRKATLDEYADYGGFLIINYEQITPTAKTDPNTEKKKLIPTFEFEAILSFGMDTLIFDEGHFLKCRKTQRYRAAFELSKRIPNLFILTGTPIMNKMPDIWTLLHMIDPVKYSSYWKFVDNPVWGCGKEINPYGGYVTGTRSKNPEAFKREIAPFFCRRLKEDVLKDLPAKTYQRLWVDLGPKEKKVYDEMEAEWLARLKGGQDVAAPVVISQITRLKQFCVSPDLAIMPTTDEKMGHGYNTAKFKALLDLLESTDQKFVVFSQFERAVTLGMMMCEKHGIKAVRHTGKENTTNRDEAIKQFKCDPATQVIFLTIRSGGLGLNLTEAANCVFLDKDWTPAWNEQAAARIHRPGQKLPCTVYEILVQNSVESWLVEAKLQDKSDMIKEIIRMKEETLIERQLTL